VGIPLPLISYGGSSLLTFTALLFILIKIRRRQTDGAALMLIFAVCAFTLYLKAVSPLMKQKSLSLLISSSPDYPNRPKGSILVEVQPFVIITDNDIILLDTGLGYLNKLGVLQIHENLMALGIDPSKCHQGFFKSFTQGPCWRHQLFASNTSGTIYKFPLCKVLCAKKRI